MANLALLSIDWGQPVVPVTKSEAFDDAVRAITGMGPTRSLAHLAWAPWLAELSTAPAVRPCTSLDQEFMALAVLVGAQSHACRFCYGALVAMLRIAGIDDALLVELEQSLQGVRLPEQSRRGLEFVRRSSSVDPRHRRGLADLAEAGFTREQAAELTFLVGLEAFSSRLATPLALPPEALESLVSTWWGRALRPLLAFVTLRIQGRHGITPLAPQERAGPFERLVAELGPSPAARLLRRTIDGCITSGLAELRTKALAMAVVGRAAGCRFTEEEARALCRRAAIEDGVVDEVLAHLSSAALSPFERKVVRYARQSVRYEVGDIQALTRDLADGVPPAVLVDVVGAVALANAMVRMSLLLDTE